MALEPTKHVWPCESLIGGLCDCATCRHCRRDICLVPPLGLHEPSSWAEMGRNDGHDNPFDCKSEGRAHEPA